MISTQKMADVLTAKLNKYAGKVNGQDFRFLIHCNEGDLQAKTEKTQRQLPTILVNGVLIEQSSTPVPLEGLDCVLLMQTLQVLVPCDMQRVSGRAEYALTALNAFVADIAGNVGALTDDENKNYSYVLSVSTPFVGTENYFSDVGAAIPISLQISWQFILGGVLANAVKMKLGVKDSAVQHAVVLMDGGIVRTRTGDSTNVENSEEMQTAVTQQGLTIKVIMPYKRNDASQMLFNDMLVGTLKRVYTLSYDDGDDVYDGVSATFNVCAREITAPLTAGKVMTISATFEIAKTEI